MACAALCIAPGLLRVGDTDRTGFRPARALRPLTVTRTQFAPWPQADASGDDGEEEEYFDNASQDS
eukprot:6305658-Prymnesium_polylepis.1